MEAMPSRANGSGPEYRITESAKALWLYRADVPLCAVPLRRTTDREHARSKLTEASGHHLAMMEAELEERVALGYRKFADATMIARSRKLHKDAYLRACAAAVEA